MRRRLAKFGAVRESVSSVGFRLVTWWDAGQPAGFGKDDNAAAASALRPPLRRFAGGMAALVKVKYRVRTDETPASDTTYCY